MNKLIIFFIPLLLLMGSCGSQKVVATKYYLIEIPLDSIIEVSKSNIPITEKYCEITTVDVNPAYSSTQIANRSSSSAITYYSHHHWAIRPAQSFSRLILDYFSHISVFENVSDRFWRVQPEYNLETTIYHLEVMQEDKTFSAHLNLEFHLIEVENQKAIVHHAADRYMELEDKDLNLFAKSIGEMLYQELEVFAEKISTELKE